MHYQIYDALFLLARNSSTAPTGPEVKGLSLSWALVIFGLLLGLALTLTPAKRSYEVKRPKDDD
jgi:hypothetical protein